MPEASTFNECVPELMTKRGKGLVALVIDWPMQYPLLYLEKPAHKQGAQ